MVIKAKLSESATEEYERIIRYLTTQLRSPQAADNFENEFKRVLSIACKQPEIFALSNDPHLAQQGYRVLLFNKYLALYTYRDDKIIVAHIFHQTQDYARLV